MISIIAAIGKKRELGKDNKLLWHISEDFRRFKELTLNHVVIMGRKTYESLPEKFRPLPDRINIVISRHPEPVSGSRNKFGITQLIYCLSIEKAIDIAKKKTAGEIFIIGGASIYKQGIKYAGKLYLTLVDKEFPDADTYFPDYSEFRKKVFEEEHRSNDLQYKYVELVR